MAPQMELTPQQKQPVSDYLTVSHQEIANPRVFLPNEGNPVVLAGDTLIADEKELAGVRAFLSHLEKMDQLAQIRELTQSNLETLGLPTIIFNSLRKDWGMQTAGDLVTVVMRENAFSALTATRHIGEKYVGVIVTELFKAGLPLNFFDNSLITSLVKYGDREKLLEAGLTQSQLGEALAEINRPKDQSMVREKKVVVEEAQPDKTLWQRFLFLIRK